MCTVLLYEALQSNTSYFNYQLSKICIQYFDLRQYGLCVSMSREHGQHNSGLQEKGQRGSI